MQEVAPLPESLRRLPEQFYFADEHKITADLVEGVRRLVQSAWDGSMINGDMYGGGIPLGDAIRNSTVELDTAVKNRFGSGPPLGEAIRKSTVELDAAALVLMATAPEKINALLVGVDNYNNAFNNTLFPQDVVKAFTNLKNLCFDSMGTKDFDYIQAALSKHGNVWRQGPKRIEVFVIRQFCLRMSEFVNGLKFLTGRTFEAAQINGSSPSSSSMRQAATQPTHVASERVMNYQNERIVGSSQWPSCVDNNKPNWATLFGLGCEMYGLGGEDQDIWLTPRMAAKIHHIAIIHGESLLEEMGCKTFHPRLPKIARPFFQRSEVWRLAFRDCYVRIGLRLQKGLPPQPNCTGEEMAFHNIMQSVPDAEDGLNEYIQYLSLPKYLHDDDYSSVYDYAIEDEDVLGLFEPNDRGFGDSDDDEDDNDPNVDNVMLGSGGAMMRTANLHPKNWFLAFRNDRFCDHIQSNIS